MIKTKYKVDGILDKYKAQLVTKGYAQKKDISYEETFSPITNMKIIKITLEMVT